METQLLKLSQVKVNGANPRTITTEKFQKLINSILVFPKMLEIRPIVIGQRMEALGGNMRLQALRAIAKMPVEDIARRMLSQADYHTRSEAEKQQLTEYWAEWLCAPTVCVVPASHLTESERNQFLIKDNVSYGTWDYDALANKWDSNRLEDWGMDVWPSDPAAFVPLGATPQAPAQPAVDPSETDDPMADFQDALPPELRGTDLTPDTLPKIEGEDNTPRKHIILTYQPEEFDAVAALLGVATQELSKKVVFRIEEIDKLREKAAATSEPDPDEL